MLNYNETAIINCKSTRYNKPFIRTLEVDACVSKQGKLIIFDLDVNHRYLNKRNIVLDSSCCTITYNGETYQCKEAFSKGSPHHMVVFTTLIEE